VQVPIGRRSLALRKEVKRMSGERSPSSPSFWNELYWFVAICLVGWIVGALVLPPRISETVRLLRQERRVLADNRAIQEEENKLEGAVSAVENDRFFLDGVYRALLGRKKVNEEYLERPTSPIR
jgi:hypothetical protein